jgi:hypothetical protein
MESTNAGGYKIMAITKAPFETFPAYEAHAVLEAAIKAVEK